MLVFVVLVALPLLIVFHSLASQVRGASGMSFSVGSKTGSLHVRLGCDLFTLNRKSLSPIPSL